MAEPNWISNTIAGLALLVSGVTLYLQRRDARPRLTILASDDDLATRLPDGMGGYSYTGPKAPAQIFEIRNVGDREVRIQSVRARWIGRRSSDVSGDWNRTPLLEPDTMCRCTVFKSQLLHDLGGPPRTRLPFCKVEFLNSVGRTWSAGYRRVRGFD
jgi:hypothetical protein